MKKIFLASTNVGNQWKFSESKTSLIEAITKLKEEYKPSPNAYISIHECFRDKELLVYELEHNYVKMKYRKLLEYLNSPESVFN